MVFYKTTIPIRVSWKFEMGSDEVNGDEVNCDEVTTHEGNCCVERGGGGSGGEGCFILPTCNKVL
jgi:hypothetical protein